MGGLCNPDWRFLFSAIRVDNLSFFLFFPSWSVATFREFGPGHFDQGEIVWTLARPRGSSLLPFARVVRRGWASLLNSRSAGQRHPVPLCPLMGTHTMGLPFRDPSNHPDRSPGPSELFPQSPLISSVAESGNTPVIELPGGLARQLFAIGRFPV